MPHCLGFPCSAMNARANEYISSMRGTSDVTACLILKVVLGSFIKENSEGSGKTR